MAFVDLFNIGFFASQITALRREDGHADLVPWANPLTGRRVFRCSGDMGFTVSRLHHSFDGSFV